MRLVWVFLAAYALVSVWLAAARHLPPLPIVAADLVVVQHGDTHRNMPARALQQVDCPAHRVNPMRVP